MTKLSRIVKRELIMKCPEGRYRGRPINLSLIPGDYLIFQVKGTRHAYKIAIGHCYNLAFKMAVEDEYKEKLRSYENLKRSGKKPRKPAKPQLNLNPKLYT